MKRWILAVIAFIALLTPAWWLNDRIAWQAAMRFDPFSTDSSPMTSGEVDLFWPPLNDIVWTREPPEEAQKTSRWGFTRFLMSHTSGADLVISVYMAGFPMRAFQGEIRYDPNRGENQIDLRKVVSQETGEEHWLPRGRLWFGSVVNTLLYAATAWLLVCGPILWLTRPRANET